MRSGHCQWQITDTDIAMNASLAVFSILPVDLWLIVFEELSIKEVIPLELTCKFIRDLIGTAPALKYRKELFLRDKIPVCLGIQPISERLHRLRSSESAWNTLDLHCLAETHVADCIDGEATNYSTELSERLIVCGEFVYGHVFPSEREPELCRICRVHVPSKVLISATVPQLVPSLDWDPNHWTIWSVLLSYSKKDSLLVAFVTYRIHSHFGMTTEGKFLLFLSPDLEPHPARPVPIELPKFRYDSRRGDPDRFDKADLLCVAGEHVVLLYHGYSSTRVFAYNWKTGERTKSEGRTSWRTFTTLSKDLLVAVTKEETTTIELWKFRRNPDSLQRLAVLQLPDKLHVNEISFLPSTSLFSEDESYRGDPEADIFAIRSTRWDNEGEDEEKPRGDRIKRQWLLVVHRETLLTSCFRAENKTTHRPVPWAAWGASKTQIIRCPIQHHIVLMGSRVLLVTPSPLSFKMYDFGRHVASPAYGPESQLVLAGSAELDSIEANLPYRYSEGRAGLPGLDPYIRFQDGPPRPLYILHPEVLYTSLIGLRFDGSRLVACVEERGAGTKGGYICNFYAPTFLGQP